MIPEILYEDNQVIVAVKPDGVLSQSDGSSAPDMLTIIKDHIKVRDSKPGNVYLALLHRLDRNVEGVMVFAKTDKAASRINTQIREHKMEKRYRAVVNGLFEQKQGVMEDMLTKQKVRDGFQARAVKTKDPDAKPAKLTYNVIAEGTFNGKPVTLVDIDLETGRYHQIRCQMSSRSHPLLGDAKYGDKTFSDGHKICLQSYKIGFEHPVKHEPMEFVLPMKDEEPWNIFGGID